MRLRFAATLFLFSLVATHAQQTVVTCPSGQVATPTAPGQSVTVVCVTPAPPPPPPPVEPPPPPPPTGLRFAADPTAQPAALPAGGGSSRLSWTVTGTPTSQSIEPGVGTVGANTRNRTVTVTQTTTYRICLFAAGVTAECRSVTVTVASAPPVEPPPPPPPTTPPASAVPFGYVDPVVLGTCSAATHDGHKVQGPNGEWFRTWHPQIDPSGCVYAHEHGDNPATLRWPTTEAGPIHPVRFGYIGRRHPVHGEPDGRDEPHEGFKVFVANRGDVNDEGLVNRVFSRSVFHMGTGGPPRFDRQHHSADISVFHPEFGLLAKTQLMMDTGGLGAVCDPRTQAPVKDVIQLQSPCLLNSGYEIWSTQQSVVFQGREVYRAFATPAVFDPITILNPADHAERVLAWDPRVAAIKRFPENDWSGNRGCERENYAQPGYWYNAGGRTTYWTNALGQEVAATDPTALEQTISLSNSIGAPATNNGQVQFKRRINYCDGTFSRNHQNTGERFPQPGIFGTLDKSKLGLKN
jgi:hypothetical protein